MAAAGRELFDEVRRGQWTPFLWLASQREAESTPGERVQRLVEECSVVAVLTRYAYYYDASNVDRVMSLFTEDAVVFSARGTYVGKAAIDANYRWVNAQRKLSYHRITNTMVRFSSGYCEAWMTAYFNAMGQNHDETRRANAGNYFARLVKTDDGWMIADFRMMVDLAVGFSAGPGAPVGGSAPQPSVLEHLADLHPRLAVEALPPLW